MNTTRLTTTVATLLLAVCASAATFTVTNTDDSGPGSLRQAVLNANAAGGGTVAFNITSSSRQIVLHSTMPIVASGTIVDGTTQPGYAGAPLIEIDGSQVPGDGLSAHCFNGVVGTLNALAIGNCGGSAIESLAGSVTNSYIGLSASGSSARRNNVGILSGGSATLATIANNVISGNGMGIWLSFAGNVLVTNNRIGTNAAGTTSIPNGTGIFMQYTVDPATVSNNLISGNSGTAVEFFWANGGIVRQNQIGVSATGAALGNGVGISVHETSLATVANNVVRSSAGAGIRVDGTSIRNRITQNSLSGNGFGIDLVSGSYPYVFPTPNDAGDSDTGPNTLQNSPLLTNARSMGWLDHDHRIAQQQPKSDVYDRALQQSGVSPNRIR